MTDQAAGETIKHLQDQLDLANSRMQSANHAFQTKTNEALELHAQFLLVQKKNADLMQMQANNQKLIDELQRQVVELKAKDAAELKASGMSELSAPNESEDAA